MEIDSFLDQHLGEVKKETQQASAEDLPEEVRFALEQGWQGAMLSPAKAPPEKELKKEQPEKKAEHAARASGDAGAEIDSLISDANALISKGDFDGARQIYIRIKEMKTDLPQKFKKEDRKISESLLNLNERFIEGMDKALGSEFNENFTMSTKLLDEAYTHISNNVIANAAGLAKVEDIYGRIKQIYAGLPEGFIEKKVMLQDQMLKIYRIIITNKKRILSDDFSRKSGDIVRMMKSIADEIGKGNFENASALFMKATQTYKVLPRGFLAEKTNLQSSILDIYQKLMLGRGSRSHEEFEQKSAEIKRLFEDAYSSIKSGKLEEASKLYSRTADLHSKLPAGYYLEKIELEIQMMELHHIIELKKDKDLLEEAKTKSNEIDALLGSARNYIAARDYDMAKQAYEEAVEVYNSLPHGFFEQNVRLQGSIIGLYKELISHMHESVIAGATGEEKGKYEQLIRLLVDIHGHIKKMEFGEIKQKYLAAYRLYHEMPLGVIQENKTIYAELYKVYEELRLYTSIDRLAEHAEKKEYAKMAELLDTIAEQYNMLSRKYQQDAELFKYIQSKCLLYLETLKRTEAEKEDSTGRDVREKIEAAASARAELGGRLPVNPQEGKEGAQSYKKQDAENTTRSYIQKRYS